MTIRATTGEIRRDDPPKCQVSRDPIEGRPLELKQRQPRTGLIRVNRERPSRRVNVLGTRIINAPAANAAFEGKEFQRSPHFSANAAIEWRRLDRLRIALNTGTIAPILATIGMSPIAGWAGRTSRCTRRLNHAPLHLVQLRAQLFRQVLPDLLLDPPSLATAGQPRDIGVGIDASSKLFERRGRWAGHPVGYERRPNRH